MHEFLFSSYLFDMKLQFFETLSILSAVHKFFTYLHRIQSLHKDMRTLMLIKVVCPLMHLRNAYTYVTLCLAYWKSKVMGQTAQ